MKTVRLYGELGDTFGREFKFEAKNAAECLGLLRANFKDFNTYLLEHNEPGFHVFIDSTPADLTDLTNPSSDREVIKIVPVVAGNGDVGKIILGAALIYITAGGAGGALGSLMGGASGFAGTALGSSLISATASLGTALVLTGISQMLFSPPPVARTLTSYSFNGAENTTKQGSPIPIGYGRCLVGSVVASMSISTVEDTTSIIPVTPVL